MYPASTQCGTAFDRHDRAPATFQSGICLFLKILPFFLIFVMAFNTDNTSHFQSKENFRQSFVLQEVAGCGHIFYTLLCLLFYWNGEVLDFGERKPWEFTATADMANIQDLQHTVSLKAAPDTRHIDDELLSYRLYTAWAGFGDLDSLIQRHLQAPVRTVPEPFIWFVAEALAKAGHTMRFGHPTDASSNWNWGKEIVHRDLKPVTSCWMLLCAIYSPTPPTRALRTMGLPLERIQWTHTIHACYAIAAPSISWRQNSTNSSTEGIFRFSTISNSIRRPMSSRPASS